MKSIYQTCVNCGIAKLSTPEFFYKNKGCRLGIDTTCKECSKARAKKWEQDNKEHKRKRQNTYRKTRKEKDVSFRSLEILRKRTWDALKGINKSKKTTELLGCSVDDFVKYLELQFNSKMNWSNQGKYWHIDHIIPCSLYDLSIKDEQEKCFNYKNLRPLSKNDNFTKSNNLDMDLVIRYDIQDLLPKRIV